MPSPCLRCCTAGLTPPSSSHRQAAAALGKPLVVEEYGKNAGASNATVVRDPWFSLVSGAVGDSLANGAPLRGALFWAWVSLHGMHACMRAPGDPCPRARAHGSVAQQDFAGAGQPAVGPLVKTSDTAFAQFISPPALLPHWYARRCWLVGS